MEAKFKNRNELKNKLCEILNSISPEQCKNLIHLMLKRIEEVCVRKDFKTVFIEIIA